MAVEIERKYLIKNDQWQVDGNGENLVGVRFRQGYLSSNPEATVRVRLQGDAAKLTIKGKTKGISRAEYEYDIPLQDANAMLDSLCQKPLIEKVRYFRKLGELTWEIDVFEGDNQGLVVAEVELESEHQNIDLPNWVGEEVSGDPRYYNVNLIAHPYKDWHQ